MNKQTYLPHTADVRLKVEADTLEELFEGALQGLSHLLNEGCKENFSCQVVQKVSINAVDLTALLIDFLSQALTLSYAYKAVFCKLSVDQLEDTSLDGCLYGCYVDSFDEDIKAVTYHEADVRQNEAGQWETMLVFDI